MSLCHCWKERLQSSPAPRVVSVALAPNFSLRMERASSSRTLTRARPTKRPRQSRPRGGDAFAIPGDVTAADFAPRLIKAALDGYGAIDAIVNNAGYTWDGTIHKMSDEQWQAMLDVHLTAPFRIIRAASEYLRETAKREKADSVRLRRARS